MLLLLHVGLNLLIPRELNFREMMERLTIIHANVWTCAVTKCPDLTLEEAFLSEKVWT